MSVKREAAYHEASHAVLTHASKFHSVIGGIELRRYGAGNFYASLSKSKCAANEKPQDVSAQKDGDVAREIAVILCAGLVGEQIASEQDCTLTPSPDCAEPDHTLARQQLDIAGLSKNLDLYQSEARDLLEQQWEAVERLATYLFANPSASAQQVIAIIGGT